MLTNFKEVLDKIRKYENLHIVFWLMKDSCWMMEWKVMGAMMIVPTLFLAVFIVLKSIKTNEFYVNIAIFFWILANSFWMVMEFFNNNVYKNFAAFPFAFGFLFVGLYFLKTRSNTRIN